MRVHVIVTAPATSGAATELLARHADDDLVVVAPLLLDRLHRWTSDDRRARASAAVRLTGWLDALASLGCVAEGRLGADGPAQAIDDAMAVAHTVVVFRSAVAEAQHEVVRGDAREQERVDPVENAAVAA